MKCTRNKLWYPYKLLICSETVDWSYIKALYESQGKLISRLAPKITCDHIHKRPFNSMKVKFATESAQPDCFSRCWQSWMLWVYWMGLLNPQQDSLRVSTTCLTAWTPWKSPTLKRSTMPLVTIGNIWPFSKKHSDGLKAGGLTALHHSWLACHDSVCAHAVGRPQKNFTSNVSWLAACSKTLWRISLAQQDENIAVMNIPMCFSLLLHENNFWWEVVQSHSSKELWNSRAFDSCKACRRVCECTGPNNWGRRISQLFRDVTRKPARYSGA